MPKAPSGRKPGRPRREPPVDNAEAICALAEQLHGPAQAYAEARTTVVAAESAFLDTVLAALGPASAILCELPERAVQSLAGSEPTEYVVLVTRSRDAIVLWNDGRLALVPYEGDGGGAPVHFASAQEFVEHAGVGFARQIAVALGRLLKTATGKVPTLTADLHAYAATLPQTEGE